MINMCKWKSYGDEENMPNTYEGECGAVWTFTEGNPAENGMNYCSFCGGSLEFKAGEA